MFLTKSRRLSALFSTLLNTPLNPRRHDARLLFALGGALFLGGCAEPNQEQTSFSDSVPGYTRIDERDPNDPLNASIYELDNGLRVYLTENHEEPRFYAEIAVRAGSKHDPADATRRGPERLLRVLLRPDRNVLLGRQRVGNGRHGQRRRLRLLRLRHLCRLFRV